MNALHLSVCQQNGVSIMVQVALGPDATGEKVSPSALRLTLKGNSTKLFVLFVKISNSRFILFIVFLNFKIGNGTVSLFLSMHEAQGILRKLFSF